MKPMCILFLLVTGMCSCLHACLCCIKELYGAPPAFRRDEVCSLAHLTERVTSTGENPSAAKSEQRIK
jgi:hypothetical protein